MVTVPTDSLGMMTPKARSPWVGVAVFLALEIPGAIVAVAVPSAACAKLPEENNAQREKRTTTLFFMGTLPFYFHDGGCVSEKDNNKV
jgi:hypothetical protein